MSQGLSGARRPSLVDFLPAELTQTYLRYLDTSELCGIVRYHEDLANHALQVIKLRFLDNKNSLTRSYEASVEAYHQGKFQLQMGRPKLPSVQGEDPIADLIQNDEVRIMQALLDAGMDAGAYSLSGYSLLGLALIWHATSVATLLIDRMKPADLLGHASVGAWPQDLLGLTTYQGTDLFYQMWQRVRHIPGWRPSLHPRFLWQLCGQANAALADELLAHGVDLSKASPGDDGDTPWHMAAMRNRSLDFLEWLYRRIPEKINMPNAPLGFTPLMSCAMVASYSTEAIQWLLEHGADPTYVSRDGRTAVMIAELYYNHHLVPFLTADHV